MVTCLKLIVSNVEEDAGQLEISNMAGGGVKWYHQGGKLRIYYDSLILLLGIYKKINFKNMHTERLA